MFHQKSYQKTNGLYDRMVLDNYSNIQFKREKRCEYDLITVVMYVPIMIFCNTNAEMF